jgi:hypothetical protein
MPSCYLSASPVLLAALLAPPALPAQTSASAPTIAPEEYAARRDSLAAGVDWLSRAPREPAEIESAMARRGH